MPSLSPYIGSVFGIKVQLHWSFLLLILLSLAISLYSTPILYFFLLIVLLFFSVFIHELSHSITAKRNGIAIKKIVLLPIGGASIIDDNNLKPDVEFKISIVGPLMSIFIGCVFGALSAIINIPVIEGILQFLFLVNILLGIFNILPGFPLDGGRVLRSYLQKKRDVVSATKLAVKISNIFIILFVFGTLIYVLLMNGYSLFYKEFIFLWDLFIGVYLYGGANAELFGAYVKKYTHNMTVSTVVTKNYSLINITDGINALYNALFKGENHILLIKDGDNFRVMSKIITKNIFMLKDLDLKKVSAPIPKVQYKQKLNDALHLMVDNNSGIAAVIRDGELYGVLTEQHAEAAIALHISKKVGTFKTNKNS